jgi:hypothetical protein
MKKLPLLYFLLFAITIGSYAQSRHNRSSSHQSDNISKPKNCLLNSLNESFENTFPPDGWVLYSPDGGSGWTTVTTGSAIPGWNGGTVVGTPDGNGGIKQAFCTWTTGGAANNDQWLVTPQIAVGQNYELSFWIRKFGNYNDEVFVKISTVTNDIEDFGTTLADITYQVHDSGWMKHQYSLADYAGQNIYIAINEFVSNTYTDGAAIFVDQLKVDQTTAINDIHQALEVKLMPNPASDYLEIFADFDIRTIKIFNIEGDLIKSATSDSKYSKISTAELSSGLYFIRIDSDFGSRIQKFCITR